MDKQETIKRAVAYTEKLPGVDPEIVRQGLSIFYLHREIDMLKESYAIKKYGLSSRHMDTLEVLLHNQDKALTPAQLADEIHLTRSAMTSNLDSLERKGYLSRKAHPDDRRMIIISLTEKGLEVCDEIIPTRYRDMSRVMNYLSAEMREMLEVIYNKVMQGLGQMLMDVST
jgi:DNA-binding MarR family transcriptional regulator